MALVTKNKWEGLSGRLFNVLPYILTILLWLLLITQGRFFLKKVEDLSLFMFDWQYFNEAIRIPGGLLGALGSFFTQFLYLPWLGSLIWVLSLLITYALTVKAFNLPDQFKALAIIPIALFVIGNMSLGYGVFIMREQDHFFAPVLGYIASFIPLFAIKRTKTTGNRILLLVIWTVIGFPLLGTFALTGTLTAACVTLMDQQILRGKRLYVLATGIALIILVPLVAYNFYTSYRLTDSWYLGLPSISEDLWTRAIRTPFQLALLFLPVMAIASHWFKENGKNIIFQSSIYIISVAAVWAFWFKDDNFRTELAMSEAIDRFEWQEVIDIYKRAVSSHAKSDAKAYSERTAKLKGVKDQNTINEIIDAYNGRFFEPTRTMVLYRDIALLKMDLALDEAFTMKDGGRPQKSRTQVPMVLQSGKQLYFQYGLPNLCYRWCIEDAVEHGWSIGTLKYMSMLSVLTGEKEMAMKFLNKLDKTLFHKKWSKDNRITATTEQIAEITPYNKIIPLMCYEDNMTNDMGKCESHLIRHFSNNHLIETTSDFNQASLLWAMRIQSIPVFWNKLILYLNSTPGNSIPRSIQEAIILYNSLEGQKEDLPVDQTVRNSYDTFTQYVERHPVRSLTESSYPYYQKFGKTFYYYYYFVRNLQTY